MIISDIFSNIMGSYINRRAKGKISIIISRAEVAYLVDYCWSKENPCNPKDLERYKILFNLTVNSQRNIPTNIHGIELHVEFCNGKTFNITDVLKAKTHSGSLIEEPLTINVAENGAYSANYSAVLEREDYWRSLDNDQTPSIVKMTLTYKDDRNEQRSINIVFTVREPLSDTELAEQREFDFPAITD